MPHAEPFNPQNAKQLRVLTHDRQLFCCRFSHDGHFLFAAGADAKLHRWRLDDDSHAQFEAAGGWIESIVMSPSGDRLFTADSWGDIRCWPTAGEMLKPIWQAAATHKTWLRRLTSSSDGKLLASCGNDRMVRVFNASDGKLVAETSGHSHCVQSVAFHPDNKSLVSGDQHGGVRQWDPASGKLIREFDAGQLFKVFHQYEQGGVRCMTFDPKGETLFCAGFEGINANQAQGIPTALAFDWKSAKLQRTMKPQADFKGPILDIACHPTGCVVGAGSSEAGGALWFWNPGETQDAHVVKNATSFRGFDFDASGDQLAAAAFGDRGGQRGGNGRRLDKEGSYPGFAGNIVLYSLQEKAA